MVYLFHNLVLVLRRKLPSSSMRHLFYHENSSWPTESSSVLVPLNHQRFEWGNVAVRVIYANKTLGDILRLPQLFSRTSNERPLRVSTAHFPVAFRMTLAWLAYDSAKFSLIPQIFNSLDRSCVTCHLSLRIGQQWSCRNQQENSHDLYPPNLYCCQQCTQILFCIFPTKYLRLY